MKIIKKRIFFRERKYCFMLSTNRSNLSYVAIMDILTQRTLRIHKYKFILKSYVVFRIINHILLSICIHNYLISTIWSKEHKELKRCCNLKIATNLKKNCSTFNFNHNIDWMEEDMKKEVIFTQHFTIHIMKISIMYVLHQPKHSIFLLYYADLNS